MRYIPIVWSGGQVIIPLAALYCLGSPIIVLYTMWRQYKYFVYASFFVVIDDIDVSEKLFGNEC
jgi:hypothetical protein